MAMQGLTKAKLKALLMRRFESGKTMNSQTTFDFSVGLSGASVHGPLEPEARRSICSQCGGVSNNGKAFCSRKCVAKHASFAAKRKALDKPNPITCGVCLCRVGFGLKLAQRISGVRYVSIRGRLIKSGGYAKLRVSNAAFRKQKSRATKTQEGFPQLLSRFNVTSSISADLIASIREWRREKKRKKQLADYYANRSKLKEQKKSYAKLWYQKNKERKLAYSRSWRANNPIKLKQYRARHNKHKYTFEQREEKRKRTLLHRRISFNLRNRLKKFLFGKERVEKPNVLFGCSASGLRMHLESLFHDGMTWDNYGAYWHIDHIRPLASFNLKDARQRAEASHYLNLQPLEAKKNIAKGSFYNGVRHRSAASSDAVDNGGCRHETSILKP